MSHLMPTKEQIILYSELQKLVEPHFSYTDQVMSIAQWIDRNYVLKSESEKHLISPVGLQGISPIENKVKSPNDCNHYKRQYIPELNKDLCLNCGKLIN